MAQWVHMSQMIQCLPDETINNLYPPSAFPIEVRHFLAEWIESQRWYATTYVRHIHIHMHANSYTHMLVYIHAYFIYCVFVRCLCVDQCVCAHRDDFALEKVEQESQAQALLDQTISLLQSIAQQNANVVDRMKLMQISRNMVGGL